MSNQTAFTQLYLLNCNKFAEQLYSKQKQYLLDSELNYIDAVKATSRKLEFIGSRILLRHVLASHLKCPINDLYFEKNNKGKPNLPLFKNCFFNLSHSHGMVAFAWQEGYEIGIDLEVETDRKNNLSKLLEHYFHDNEIASLSGKSEESLKSDFFKIWTAKEAIAKAASIDLFTILKSIDLSDVINKRVYQFNFQDMSFYLDQLSDCQSEVSFLTLASLSPIENLEIFSLEETANILDL